ncbi:MAG: helix-turn-helix domain-containing protein, partial [Burkholderiales bacterium]
LPRFDDKKIPMPNIAAVLKQEIARVARRETRSQIDMLRKTSAQQRRGIAALKRSIASLQRQVGSLAGTIGKSAAAAPDDGAEQRVRFSSKGIRSLRHRLGLSAGEFARLVDVSAQSIYNWEHQVTRPRAAQVKALAELRGLGKREVAARLQSLDGGSAAKRRGASASAK